MNAMQLFVNGVNGATGSYLLPQLSPRDISKLAQGIPLDEDEVHLKVLENRYHRSEQEFLGVKEGVDATNLSETGWAVVFAFEDDGQVPGLKEALEPLLEFRRNQAGELYREFSGPDGYRPKELARTFLARHGASPADPADPEKVPYYLLIVGDPETIPYRFQYQLDVQYAVGRLHFDELDDYSKYAQCVVESENGQVALPRRATFFGVSNEDDPATILSAQQLVRPLAGFVQKDHPDWTVDGFGKPATKAYMTELLSDVPPALLFTASHGMGFPKEDPRQLQHQGALLCQDWPGPLRWKLAIPEDHYFSADDVADDASVKGMIAFHFACYGAGTPRTDDFAHLTAGNPVDIAPHSFVSRLPQRMLSHKRGSALAIVGHVERAWTYSFMWQGVGQSTVSFEATLKRLMAGHPVGSAMEYFDDRYAALAAELTSTLQNIKYGSVPNDIELAGLWTAHNDARSYVIIGDPAVRLCITGSHQ